MASTSTTQGQTVVPATLARYDAATRAVEATRRQVGGLGRFLRPPQGTAEQYFIRITGDVETGFSWESDAIELMSVNGDAKFADSVAETAISATSYIVLEVNCASAIGSWTLTTKSVTTLDVYTPPGTGTNPIWRIVLCKIVFLDGVPSILKGAAGPMIWETFPAWH